MGDVKKVKKFGFLPKATKTAERKQAIKEPRGRHISWSPANFQSS